jgi:hypothetical protein
VSPRERAARVTVIVDQTCKADCVPFQSEHPLVLASTKGMLWPEATSSNLDEQLDVSQQYVELLLVNASPEPVTSTGDGSTSITIQGDEGTSPAIAVLAFIVPLIIVALALGGVYQLLRWIERRRG